MRINLTADDMAKGALIEPGWHNAEVIKAVEAPSKTDGSTNLNVSFKLLSGPQAGAQVTRTFNEKAQGFMKNYLLALGVKVDDKNGFTGEIVNDKMVGKKMKIQIVRGEYKGKPKNEVDDFAPLGA